MVYFSGPNEYPFSKITRRLFFALSIFCAAIFFTACRTTDSADEIDHPPLTLIVGVDGISYSTFSRMQAEGKLPLFKKVAPMVASFPSISDPSWSLLMQVPKPAGYTKEYFDPTQHTKSGEGKEVGSILAHIEEPPLYERGFDHHVEGIIGHVANLAWLITSVRIWIEEIPDHFFRMRNRNTFWAFTLNSDLISHTQGEPPVEDFLIRLEHQLERMEARMKRISSVPFEIILISDHGNQFFTPKMVQFEDVLTKAGWNRADHLNSEKDFAFTAPEIISFGAFYILPGGEQKFAKDLISVPGMESTLYREDFSGNVIRILTEGGKNEAQVKVDPANQTVTMKVLKGKDFFDQNKYFKNGPVGFDTYFQQSYKDEYPNVAVRAWEGFHINCEFPGSVLASTQKNFAFGNPTIEILTAFKNLYSMHGSLRKEETWGIFASSQREFPPIRPQDFRNWVDLREYHANLKD